MKKLIRSMICMICLFSGYAISADLSASSINLVSFDRAPLSMIRAQAGPIATALSTYPNFIEFQRSGQSVKGSIGSLGSFEMNMSVNMNYSDGVHRLYDKTKDSYWTALNTGGMYLQFAPASASNGDVWDESGQKYAFVVNMNEALFCGDIKPIDNGKTSLGAAGMAFKSLYIDSATATSAGPTTINKAAGRVRIQAGQTSVVVTNELAKYSSHIFPNVATKDQLAKSAKITPSDGSFEVTINAPTDQEVAVDFFIVN